LSQDEGSSSNNTFVLSLLEPLVRAAWFINGASKSPVFGHEALLSEKALPGQQGLLHALPPLARLESIPQLAQLLPAAESIGCIA
jgi:hypothetical protein